MHHYKAAFLDLTIAAERLTAARLQLASAWAEIESGHERARNRAAVLSKEADDVQNRLNDLTDSVRGALTVADDGPLRDRRLELLQQIEDNSAIEGAVLIA